MKVLLTIGSLRFSGAERVLLFIADNLKKKGHDVTIITLQESEHVPYDNPINEEIKIININKKGNFLFKNFSRIIEINRVLKKEKPDVALSFGYILNPILILSKFGTGVPVIISERNDPIIEPKSKFYRVVRRITYPLSNKIVVQTPEIKKYFAKFINDSKISIIPNPITKSLTTKSYHSVTNTLVSVGRLDQHQKNQLMLIEAFSKVIKSMPNCKLIIYGEGNDRNLYENKIKEMNLEKSIQLPGQIINVSEKVIENDIFILSSNFEGMPNALIEAMSSGMACISTDCSGGGAKWLINNDVNGILIDRNDEDNLVQSILELLKNKEKLINLGKNAQEINQKLDQTKIIEMWIKELKKVKENKNEDKK